MDCGSPLPLFQSRNNYEFLLVHALYLPYADAHMKKFLNTVYWIGVAASLALISFGVWCHFTMDAIVRLPFVLLSVSAGLMIGFYCVEHLLRQRK